MNPKWPVHSRQNQTDLSALPEENPLPVLEMDTKGHVIYLNPAARRTFEGVEARGPNHPVVLVALDALKQLRKEGVQVAYVEVEVGGKIYVQAVSVSQDGNRIRVYVTNITKQRRLEGQIREQAGKLIRSNEELVRRERVMQSLLEDLQRTKEKMEGQAKELQSANRQLKEMVSRKNDFVAKTSHELRTPLTSIKEGLSLMLDKALGEITYDQKDFLQTMDADIDRLTELINNMLDLSKIEAGRMRLNRRAMDVRQAVKSLVQSYRPLVGGRTVEIIGNNLPEIFGDTHRLRQVFSNLFSNALKVTENDGRITFRMKHDENVVAVSVEDNGSGILPDELKKLFQKFMQVGSEGRRSRGTGLGLVVCKELTELHGGRIEVTSEVGKGTIFTVFLPIYSEVFALSESFWELLGMTSEDDAHITIIALEVPQADSAETLERKMERVRDRVHRGDVVFSYGDRYILILAATDLSGCEAIIQRLRAALPDGASMRFGWGLYPADGKSAQKVCERAIERLNTGEILKSQEVSEPKMKDTSR